MPPEAQAPSTLVQGMFSSPSSSATIPARTSCPLRGPAMKLPRYRAPISLRSMPQFLSALLAASTARLSSPLPSCLPKAVEPTPVIATSRIANVLQELPQVGLEYLAVAVLGKALDKPVV